MKPVRRGAARTTPFSDSLRRVRWRLTAWYGATFFAILALLGVGLFATITTRFDRELDESLGQDSRELARVARARADAGPGASLTAPLMDSLADLRIPDRRLYLLDTLGRPAGGASPDPWIQELARDAWHRRSAERTFTAGENRFLRGHAEGFTLANGRALIAVAVADEIELEDRYTSMIVAFSIASSAAVLLVAAGGWLLARKSTAPVEEAFAHMRRFMADAAHELRTPLAIVRSRAEVALQRRREADEYVAALNGIEKDATRIGRIVEDLLMLARADAGERPIERARVFLDDVTLDAAEAARLIADRKSIRLEVSDFEEAPIQGDATLLRQLVLILLDNAIKFTAPGGVVHVSVRAPGGAATLSVADSGIGIPADHLPHVFERFFRGDPSRSRPARVPGVGTQADAVPDGFSEGAGLGLSIARWIADEHGATIAIDSEPGRGTRVVVQFLAEPPLAAAGGAVSLS